MDILDQSLCILDGISPGAEVSLRNDGVLTTARLAADAPRLFSPARARKIAASFQRIRRAKELGLVDLLVGSLPVGHRVRALHDFFADAVFFDIETDGAGASSAVTCISSWRNGVLNTYVRNRDLDDFLATWSEAEILVSFNGKRFDTPIVARHFGLTRIPAQVDLMDEAAHYGYRGGLKAIERRLGFRRLASGGLCGADAISLWEKYCQRGDASALDRLVAYNREDVLSLVALYKVLLRRSLENTRILPIFEN